MPEYTVLAVLSVVGTLAAERFWFRTGILRTAQYWLSMAIVFAFQAERGFAEGAVALRVPANGLHARRFRRLTMDAANAEPAGSRQRTLLRTAA